MIIFLILVFCSGTVEAGETPALAQPPAQEIYDTAVRLKQSGLLTESQEAYRNLLTRHLVPEVRRTVEKELAEVNLKLVFSVISSPQSVVHVVKAGETLRKIAARYHTTLDVLESRNQLKDDLIHPGQKLSIWQGDWQILIDKTKNVLTLTDREKLFKSYVISTGKNNSSPSGEFKIVEKLKDPVWFHKGIPVPPNVPDNYLGTRWLGLNLPKYGIHGTVEPELIGKSVSGGCIRMRNEDVEELYRIVPVGTKVVIMK